MKTYSQWLNVMFLLALLLPSAGYPTSATLSADLPTTPQDAALIAASGDETPRNSPVMFIENVGQFNDGARFQVRGGNGTLWLTDDALWITIVERSAVSDQSSARFAHTPESPFNHNPEAKIKNRQGVNLRLSFPNANPNPRLEPFDRLETTVSYFLGNDPDGWRPDVPVWGGVRYVGLYPGIDLEVTSEGGQFVQRLHAQPGANLSQVQLRVEGTESLVIAGDRLHLNTIIGDYTLPLMMVEGIVLDTAPAMSFSGIGLFDIISPFIRLLPTLQAATKNPQNLVQNLQDNPSALLYSTFLGGDSDDLSHDIAVDESGASYVTGWTWSSDFPTTPGAFDISHNGGNYDSFVTKVTPDGRNLAYSTYLGGSGTEEGYGISVDSNGAAYITGYTGSSDFPTTPGAFNTNDNGVFVVKVDPDGSALAYATFLGDGGGYGIAVNKNGEAYITGMTDSPDFPVTAGAFDTTYHGNQDAFVAKLTSDGSALVFATFLGGTDFDFSRDIAIDGNGSAYVTGSTRSSNFPTTPSAFDTIYDGPNDAFVVKVSPDGSTLVYATFLGGSSYDWGSGIAVDTSGVAYVAGRTESANFPTTSEAFDTTYDGFADAFVVKMAPGGDALVYSAYLGGNSLDEAYAIAVDKIGAAYVVGWTDSADFPATSDAFSTTYNGASDAFVAKVMPDGNSLAYATFLGGSREDKGESIAVHMSGATYVTGQTTSSNFPIVSGAFDPIYNGPADTFVVKLDMGGRPVTYSISGQVRDGSENPIPDVMISTGEGQVVTTDTDGYYTITDLMTGTYTLTPSKDDYVFEPTARQFSVPPDGTEQNFVMLNSPVSITLSLSGTVSLPDSLTYIDTQGLATTVLFPVGAVTTTTTVVLTPTLATASTNLTFAGHAFQMTAHQSGTQQPDFIFNQPAIVIINYSEQDVRLISDEGSILLYRWQDGIWVDAACGPYIRWLTEQKLSVPICHLSQFALLGPTNKIYLPLILRQW